MPTESGGASQNGEQSVDAVQISSSNAGGQKPPERKDPKISARDRMLADLDAQIVEQRTNENQQFLESADPRAAALYAEMNREAAGLPISTDRTQQASAARPAPAHTEAEPAAEAAEATAAEAVQIDDQGNDPLAEFIVREAGKPPMFKTVVNGRTVLVPLDRARQQLQKHIAADVRLQQASERHKQLDAREAALRRAPAQPTASVAPAVDDATLERESVELVRSLVSEPETVAAKKVAGVLKKVVQAARPTINPEAIAQQAASTAVQTIAARDNQRALQSGLAAFNEAYPDIAADPDLWTLADRRTDVIAQEHPEWSPSQIMLEAGKQTQEWLTARTGKQPAIAPAAAAGRAKAQAAKQGLKPMPVSRIARPATVPEAPAEQTPQDVVAEIRKTRGQAY